MKQWFAPALTVALMSISGVASANPYYDPIKEADKLFAQMDANKDGKISKEEYYHPAELRFTRFDLSSDGTITREEMMTFWEKKQGTKHAWKDMADTQLRRHDKDKDGKITHDEFMLATQLNFQMIDTDHNDAISKEELREHWKTRSKEIDDYMKRKESGGEM